MEMEVIIVVLVIVCISISCCFSFTLGGGGTIAVVSKNRKKSYDDDIDPDFFEFDKDDLSIENDPFFQVNLAENELIKAEKELITQQTIKSTQDMKDKAAAKVSYAKKKVEWVKCYSSLQCEGKCVRFGDKVRIVKFSDNEAKLSITRRRANEVTSNGEDTILLFQDLGKGKTGQVKEEENLNRISQKCINYGDKTRVAKFSNQRYSLKLYGRKAYESKDENSIHTELIITGGSGKVKYGDKIRISKVGGYNLKLNRGTADEVKNDTHEGTYFIIKKA